ncbi:type II toxin-antitoxin system RelE/ParE family toxin [Oceanicoccus sagamiensis]|uniref:type II toxin-antitoxin system RelE/ParE family toxin n=1 Tax=Oceanicoccus sagamiensis TaxID=716816 RepID=UPI000A270CEC
MSVSFFATSNGNEPVRHWLKTLSKQDKLIVGTEIKTVETGWPLGMPVVRKISKGLWEVRIQLSGNKIARVLFTVITAKMILLHAFIKKSQATPKRDISLADSRRKLVIKEN